MPSFAARTAAGPVPALPVVVVSVLPLVLVLVLVAVLEAPLAAVDEVPEVELEVSADPVLELPEPPQAPSVRTKSDNRATEQWRGVGLIIE